MKRLIPHDIISDPSLVVFETRSHSSVTHTIGFLDTLIESLAVTKAKWIYRIPTYTGAVFLQYAEEVKEVWLCSKPAALHWDGKIMSDIKNKYKEYDILPILISDKDSVKLLEVPALPTKSSELTGDLQK